MRKVLLSTALLCACSVPLQQQAHIVGQSSKEIIDVEYDVWDRAANERISECEKKLTPVENFTKADFDKCVGPFNETVQEKIVIGLKVVQTAQLALFLALAQNKGDAEIRQALIDLTSSITEFVKLIQENK